jgi:hypothetical protein
VGYVEDLRGKKQGKGRPRWRARYRDPSGRERSKSFARKVDAERFLVSIEDAKLRGAYVDPAAGRVPFAEWAERWERTTATLRPSTRKDYATLLKNQVLPAFGDMTLVAIDALAVREWVAELVANGLSAKRARKAHQVLSQILASAVDGGRLPRNVAEGIKLPKVQRKGDALPDRRPSRGAGRGDRPTVWHADPGRWLHRPATVRVRGAQGWPPRPAARNGPGGRGRARGRRAPGVGRGQDPRSADGPAASLARRGAGRLPGRPPHWP